MCYGFTKMIVHCFHTGGIGVCSKIATRFRHTNLRKDFQHNLKQRKSKTRGRNQNILNNTEPVLETSVAYKKKCILQQTIFCYREKKSA